MNICISYRLEKKQNIIYETNFKQKFNGCKTIAYQVR